ncbi:MAG: DoxX family protein [Rudaea sp.]|nr:DoxX family protein [Rudaea sp.]
MRHLVINSCQAALNVFAKLQWLAPLVVRLFFGYFWLETGWAKLHNLDGAIARFVDWGIPYAAFNAPLSAGTEFVGGVLLMLGLVTRLTSAVMIFNLIVAIALVVIKNVHGFDDFVELDEFVDILIFFWLIVAGPGTVSLDALIAKRFGLNVKGMN